MNWLSANGALIESLAALTSILLIIPSALIFIVNQFHQLFLARDENHKYIIERYREFLAICLEYPQISLETGEPQFSLPLDDRLRRDIAFDILTTTFERAYVIYVKNRWRSSWRTQWKGWEQYIEQYCERSDYLEWWRRYIWENDPDKFFDLGAVQYDTGFEEFILSKLKPNFERYEADGTFARFTSPPRR